MVNLYEWPVNAIVASVLVLACIGSAERGISRLVRGLRQARSLEVVRGIRGCVVAASLALCALGLLTAQTGFLVLGAVFLSEELYETGILAAIIRVGERQAAKG
jgi:hypothetical protein